MADQCPHADEAEEAGFGDAYFDGLDMFHYLPCRCDQCHQSYYSAQASAGLKLANERRADGLREKADTI